MYLKIIILFLLFNCRNVHCQSVGCTGLSEEDAEGVLCCFENSSRPIECTQYFNKSSKLKYKCQDLYIPLQLDAHDWHEATCLGNDEWSGYPNFKIFRCGIDFGLWQKDEKTDMKLDPTPLIYPGPNGEGKIVDPVQMPWNAAIFSNTNDVKRFKCGGTLIQSPKIQFVLTAAHCVFYNPQDHVEMVLPQELVVVLAAHSGEYEEAVSQTKSPNARIFNVISYSIHPQYEGANNYFRYDIAVLMLDKKVEISKYILPVLLPKKSHADALFQKKLTLEVVGFGISNLTTNLPSNELYGVNVTTNPDNCVDLAKSNSIDYNSQICATPKFHHSMLCYGDSGGGAFFHDGYLGSKRHFIEGIVSIGVPMRKTEVGKDVDSSPFCFIVSVFTKVHTFVGWILKVVDSMLGEFRRPITERTTTESTTTITTTSTSTSVSPPIFPAYAIVSTENYLQLTVDLHNSYRRRHHAPPLKLDNQLSKEAQDYANYITTNNYVLQTKHDVRYGQNVFENDGKVLTNSDAVRLAVERWYSGIGGYNWQYPLGSAPTGYLFSQIVWLATTNIGVGVSSGRRRTVVICLYSPPGNVQSIESYNENVLRDSW